MTHKIQLTSKMLLIGLCGKMGSGKDYIASNYIIPYLKDKLKRTPLKMAFADQIKVNAITRNNISFNDVYVEKTDFTRILLQKEGTENGREKYGQDVWIKYFDAWANVYKTRGIDAIILSDVRFQNEVEYIKSKGGLLIKVHAPIRNEKRLQDDSKGNNEIYKQIKSHPSECDLDNLSDQEFTFVVDNDNNNKTPLDINRVLAFINLYFKSCNDTLSFF